MLIFLGALPKPLHGMSAINEGMRQYLQGSDVKVFNLVPSYAARLFPGRAFTLVKAIHLMIMFVPYLGVLISRRHKTNIYFSIAGGMGQLLDLPYMFAAGFGAEKIFVHHHSFAYCNRYSPLFAMLLALGRGKVMHIVLGDSMKNSLARLYGVDGGSIEVLSNIAFFDVAEKEQGQHRQLSVIGYISNISFEKGIRDFVETVQRVSERHAGLSAIIAGPCMNAEVRNYVEASCALVPGLNYIGPVYGQAKDDFYASIDVLLFPTHYANEAEPLVIYEAFSKGIPVIALGRGCIPDMINTVGGKSLPVTMPFVDGAVEIMTQWLENPAEYQRQASRVLADFPVYRLKMRRQLEKLAANMKTLGIR